MEKITIGKVKKEKKIAPELHSQFIEFLGNCISQGIWVGKESDIPNYNGFRKDVVDALKKLNPPVVRWPGGCYADMYHWRDGIGKERKITWNENFGTYEQEKNEFGTHEFMEFCEMIGAKPWLNINMLRGSVSEMVEWAEYCNRKEDTALSRERAANGSPEPFNVEYWGIGNECWGGGGNYTAQGYADEYRKFTSSMPCFRPVSLKDDGGFRMKFIACGPDGNKPAERVKWTKDFFAALANYRRPQIDAFDLHFYNWNTKNWAQPETEFDEKDWYSVLYGSMELEEVIREQARLIADGIAALPEAEGDFPAPPADCRLVVGEWGNWHGKAFLNRPALYQQCTMRDAVTTAITLDIFHRNCDIVSMACVAQTVNVLNSLILTEGPHTILTPNYYVFEMYKPHRGACVMEMKQEGDRAFDEGGVSVPNIYAFASELDGVITVNIINANMKKSEIVELNLPEDADLFSAETLGSDMPQAYNSAEEPQRIIPEDFSSAVSGQGKDWTIQIRPASVNVIRFLMNYKK